MYHVSILLPRKCDGVNVLQIMVPGKTNVSLTLSWSTDYDPMAAAEQPGAAKQGPKGDADSEVSTPIHSILH